MTSKNNDLRHRAGVNASQLLRKIEKADRQYAIFGPDDSILVGISGGKDSLSLLQLLVMRNLYTVNKARLVPVHVTGNYTGVAGEVPEELISWVSDLGLKLITKPMVLPQNESLPMNCDRCSRNRKRTLFEAADQLGCNKIALGHNMDDFAQTAFMNLLTQGRLEAMPIVSTYFERFRLIRPLVCLPEKKINRFAKLAGLPILHSSCPLTQTSHRAKARALLQQIKQDFPDAVVNIYRSALRIS